MEPQDGEPSMRDLGYLLSDFEKEVYILILNHPAGLRAVDVEALMDRPRGDHELQRALVHLTSYEFIKRRTRDSSNRTIFVATYRRTIRWTRNALNGGCSDAATPGRNG